jgi:hypothetical protein
MNKIDKENILSAIKEIDTNGVPAGRQSSTYDLIHNGKPYPPKFVISIANRFATGEELDHNTFEGGIGTPAFKLLESQGFKIQPKELNLDHQQESIIAYSDEILDYLLQFKSAHKDFTFSLRKRDSTQSDTKRLELGQWFQGSHYIFVPLFKKGDSSRKIKTFGFVLNFDKQGKISASTISISFKSGIVNENEINFHKRLAADVGITLNEHNHGDLFFDNPQDVLNNLNTFITQIRDNALSLLEEYNLTAQYIVPESEFQKDLSRINEIKLQGVKNKTESKQEATKMTFPLNQILYGPPGTGKTYNTVLEAAKIVTGNGNLKYVEALRIFNENLGDQGQIEFVTFHQNFSYEDFIQGLRPDVDNKQLSFERKDGIFKRIADRAYLNLIASEKKHSQKFPFSKVFQEFAVSNIEEGKEIEVKMIKTSYFITDISDKTIYFRKTSGGTGHTLSIQTLERMYLSESIGDIQGLASYYEPLLNILLNSGKSTTVQEVQRKNYVIIIDEINRANISRVFGELITLIEEDKRSHGAIPMRVTLPSGEPFIVPSNLYIIGTMNTADKSIALLDIALRRRFNFVPKFPDSELEGVHNGSFLNLLNKGICEKKGRDFQIGHAYFMENEDLNFVMNKKVIPLLLEYFMNDEKTVQELVSINGCTVDSNVWPMIFSKN